MCHQGYSWVIQCTEQVLVLVFAGGLVQPCGLYHCGVGAGVGWSLSVGSPGWVDVCSQAPSLRYRSSPTFPFPLASCSSSSLLFCRWKKPSWKERKRGEVDRLRGSFTSQTPTNDICSVLTVCSTIGSVFCRRNGRDMHVVIPLSPHLGFLYFILNPTHTSTLFVGIVSLCSRPLLFFSLLKSLKNMIHFFTDVPHQPVRIVKRLIERQIDNRSNSQMVLNLISPLNSEI